MVPTKAMTPHVPIATDEVLADAEACAALGASVIHVHARDDRGEPTHRAERFAPIVEGIRAIDPALVICVTCSGRRVGGLEERSEVLELTGRAKPDMASLTLGSNNFIDQASLNSPAVIRGLAERMRSRGIKPELEAFEPGMLHFGAYLARKGVVEEPAYTNILLGNLGTSPVSPASLAAFRAAVPEGWTWVVGGIGRHQLDANLLGIAAAHGVRVGLEDNIWADRRRTRLATNAEAVERIVRLAELAERPIATTAAVRARLGLPAVSAQARAVSDAARPAAPARP